MIHYLFGQIFGVVFYGILFLLGQTLVTNTALAQPLVFTAIPDQDTERLQERFNKVAVYLQEKLAIEVIYIPVKTYSASIAAFKNNAVQLAWFGGLSGVQARLAVPGSQAIALGEEDLNFVSYFIAHTSTGITEAATLPDNLAGRTFTFGSKGSTSGRLMPEYFLRQHFEKTPSQIFRRVGFSGNHSKSLQLVQSGSYELGVLNYKVWEAELAAGKINLKKVRIIWKSPSYPDYNWSIRGDVDKIWGIGFLEKVKSVLLAITDKEILQAFPRKKFVAADNKLFIPILKTAQNIGIIRK
ncbi:MAG: putative selenate ABC transporter substrate-binding protein [SAR324 cluster bacterium]|nr:putative selenate ABC transporter substrate-binding protein [SAR324 cluster bacterium]MBL7034332.1 putative selenate ABC transporter substrate-binding protein [SAR324 cluster bacterium]